MKRFLCILLVLSLCCTGIFALDFSLDQNQMSNLIGDYTEQLVYALPAEVSADNLWADAYIGQLIAIPPHVAAGINLGASFMGNNDLFADLGEQFGIPFMSYLPGAPVPAASWNLRVGGIILDFDIGVHGLFARLDSTKDSLPGSIQVNTFGADFRYCLITQKLIIPAVSIGIGYDHVHTTADMTMHSDLADLGFNFETKAEIISGTAEASWNLLFVKIFAGGRAMMPLGDGITSHAQFNATAQGQTASFDPIDAVNDKLSLHVFGGLGFRLFVIDTTLGATYDITNKNLGVSWSTRVQL